MGQNVQTNEVYALGTLQSVLFESADSYFKILVIQPSDVSFEWDEPDLIVKGTFADVTIGATYAFYGQLVRHPKYGEQLQVTRYENELPADEVGLIQYFASDQFPGVGRKTATKIVDTLGLDAVNLILQDATVLTQVGLKPKVTQQIQSSLQRNLGLEHLFQIAHQFGIGADLAGRLFEQYSEEAATILQETPYRLVFEFEGIPFKKADEIGQKMGIARDDAQRVQAAIYASLMNLTFAGGHTFVAYTQLVMQVGQLLQVSEATVISGLDVLLENGRLIQENQRLYPANLYHDEVAVAQDIKRLRDSSLTPFDTDFVETVLAQQKLTLDDAQIHAVTAALHQPLFVLTGGPGTGKTTIITTIVNAWQKWMAKKFGQTDRLSEVARQHRVLLASPTGRAAKRMTEVTGHPATTIHRLLGMVDLQQPEFDRETPLSGGLLIVDEASMLDIELTAKLLAAVPNGMRVVFVGDAQQLPSVGPGNVLADLLQSGEIPHANLQRVYRQDKQSTINLLAQHLQAGSLPEDFTTKQADRNAFMVTVQQIPDTIKKIVQAAANKGYTAQDVQILTPMYKTPAGVEALNPLLQDIFNPVSPRQKTLTYGQTTYRVGDKVLQLANDSERDIYNGDMGSITAVQSKDDPLNEDNEERLVVAFDQQTVYYPKKELHQLTLAYATTVHKAQGSEFPVVVVILTNQMTPMLNRNLLYTAITRAKQSLILVGDYRAFDRAAQQAVPPRQTALVQRLQGQIANADDQPAITQQVEAETISPIVPQRALTAHADLAEIDPMIGMGQLTPYDFMSTQ